MADVKTMHNWHAMLAVLQKGNFIAAARYERRNKLLGLPTIILSTVVGTAIFASVGEGTMAKPWVKIVTGLLSVAAAVLSSLQTFLSYAESAQKHKAAGQKYGVLRREIEAALELASDTQPIPPELYKSVRTAWDAVDLEAPPLPQDIYDRLIAERNVSG